MATEKNQEEVQLSVRLHDFIPFARCDRDRDLGCSGRLV